MPRRRANRKKDFISAYRLEKRFRKLEKHPEDSEVFEKLVDDYNNMIKYANSRMSAIEKADLGYYSDYNSAKNALSQFGYNRFPKFNIKKADEEYEEFKALSRQVRRFVTAKVGTVGEIKQHEKSAVDFWSDFYFKHQGDLGRTKATTKSVRQAIIDLSRNGLLKGSEMFYDSEIIGEAIDFIASGRGSVQEVKQKIDDYRKGRTNRRYAELFN